MKANEEGTAMMPVIAGYDAVRLLGSGSQGSVWLVAEKNGGAHLAAKCFWPVAGGTGAEQVPGSRHNESEVTQEWRVLAQCDHNHLIRVHELVALAGGGEGGWALLMDYAAGGSVRDVVAARGPLTVGEAVTVLSPMGQVLSFLHGRGVIHGDLAPGNILFSAHGKPLLGDLGFARLVGQGGPSGGGTPGFRCPVEDVLTQSSDVFSLAAVGWFALTGRPPPPTRDRMPLSMYVPGVPAELTAALEAGLDERAWHRPTAAAFAQAVFRSARAEPLALAQSVHPSVLPQLLTRGVANRRRRGWAGQVLRGRRWCRRTSKPHAGGGRRRARVRGPRVSVAAGFIAVAVVVAGFGGWRLMAGNGGVETGTQGGPHGAVTASSPPAATPAPTAAALAGLGAVASMVPAGVRAEMISDDPAIALTALAWVRSYALSNVNFTLLEAVNAAGSPAALADTAIARALEKAGHSYAGLTTAVAEASVSARAPQPRGAQASSATATVSAMITTSAFAEQDARGEVVHQQTTEQRQKLDIVLIFLNGRWMIQEILPSPG
ncbi:hypothetical protein AOC05_05140 [Arthrobacter alpinus]|uniref:non-specific serine/threonine protein kinase n=1 Tax=Arthrobacter alpinus TaxID=656366 RepID=A0A0M4RMW7_9MICC|nr:MULTISPECIES: protein kinase [Arthrobacter]ALE91858.1 hypothetical protein AOC05_05140 [Arthrobacter alpinus]